MIYELQITDISAGTVSVEILIELLANIGIAPDRVIEKTVPKQGVWLSVFFERESGLQEVLKKLRAYQLKGIRIRKKTLRTEDWRDRWKKDLKPFKLTDRFDVIPAWSKSRKRSPREPLFLDTTLAFGTGLHETTRFMAYLIEQHKGPFQRFLDIGTGTGLLSVIAAKCGAKELWAVDIDPNSVVTARANMKANHLEFDSIQAGDFRQIILEGTFDYVAANIITDELISMKDKIIESVIPGGTLAVSGISLKNLERFRRSFKNSDLVCRRILRGKAWAAILYKKKVSHA